MLLKLNLICARLTQVEERLEIIQTEGQQSEGQHIDEDIEFLDIFPIENEESLEKANGLIKENGSELVSTTLRFYQQYVMLQILL